MAEVSQFILFFLGICCLTTMSANAEPAISGGHGQPANAARYDFYRLYRLHLETEEQVLIFVQLEALSDSVVFYGHARHTGQRLTIMVAAHKVADITELLGRYNVEHQILVGFIMFANV